MSALTAEPAIEVVTGEHITSGLTVAHRRHCGFAAFGVGGTYRWPACQPRHVHECEAGGEGQCTPAKCVCICRCDLPHWHEISATTAAARGARPCPEPACFGHHTPIPHPKEHT